MNFQLEDSPNFRWIVEEEIPRAYRFARRRFLRHETKQLPEPCPYTAEQILDDDAVALPFYPR